MRRLVIVACFPALLVLLCLGGCSETKQAQSINDDDKTPLLLSYGNGIINSEGQIIFPPDGSEYTYRIWQDCEGRQRYILASEYERSETQLDGYGQPLVLSIRFSVYDTAGKLLKSVKMTAPRFDYQISPDGDLQKSLLLLDYTKTEQVYKLMDLDGKVLLEQPLAAADVWQTAFNLCMNDEAVWVQGHIYGHNYETHYYCDLYDRDLQPLELVKDYLYMVDLGYWYAGQFQTNRYLRAYYLSPNDYPLYDVLDSRGQVLLSGLRAVDCVGQGRFLVEQGFSRGLMNEKGEWLYQESIFAELED